MASSIQHQDYTFLFLQGPSCGFFSGIAEGLQRLGHRCLKVNFAAGDDFFWTGSEAIRYRGSFEEWGVFLEKLLLTERVTTIIVYGDKRPYHRCAIDIAKKHGVDIAVTDDGYLRPGFLIFESTGISGKSLLPKNREQLMLLAASAPSLDVGKPYCDLWAKKIFLLTTGALLNYFCSFAYPHYREQITDSPLRLGLGFIAQFFKKIFSYPATTQHVEKLILQAPKNPYFLYPLQIDMDFQIRTSPHYSNQLIALEEVMTSFSLHAAKNAHLVIKIHPLDPGLRAWEKIVTTMAREKGIFERVTFLYGGNLEKLLAHSSGVVTINSTVGLQALRSGKRVKNLDEAVYDIPGLIYSGTLDHFWTSEEPVDRSFCDAVVKVIASTLQIKGCYFHKRGLQSAIKEAIWRLDQNKMNQVMEKACP